MLRRRMPFATRSMATYSEKMEKTGRPISPHITIYAWPTIAISSVMMRGTGIMLSIGTAGIGLMALPGAQVPVDFAQSMASSSLAAPTKFAVGFPLVYHFLGAIRHAVWDLKAWGFTNQAMLQSSYALAGASLALSLGLSVATLPPKKAEKKM